MKRLLLLLSLLPTFVVLPAQGLMDRKHPDIFPLDGKMRRGGLYFAPGITYTLPGKEQEQTTRIAPDTSFTGTFHPAGKIGLYLEAGWFLFTRDPVIMDYWDFGLAYKQFKGSEASQGTFAFGDSIGTAAGEGVFNDQHLTVHANANKFLQIADYQFIQFSLGVNVDWRFGESREYIGFTLPAAQAFPPTFIGQAHAKLGYGFKVSKRLLIIPAVETPFFSVVPTDEGFGRLQWFNSPYRPLIFSIRFLFLRYPKGFACVPVRNNEFEKHKVVNPNYERK
jgi:hypothetical protein